MNKRKPIQARCFRDGIPVGVMTLTEWCEVADIDYNNAYNALKKGGRTKAPDGAKLSFEEVRPGEPDYIQSLSEVNEEAREKGKSYGQLQAEKYLQEHPIIKREEKTEEEEMKETEVMGVTLGMLIDMMDGTQALQIHRMTGEEPKWIATLPSDSELLTTLMAEPVFRFNAEYDGDVYIRVILEGRA